MEILYQEALERFSELFRRAAETDLREPTAFTLATVDARGQPSARVVLLRGFDERGFVFFTNSQSRKGKELLENSKSALCFHWDALREQVRIEGEARPIDSSESDTYWNSRARQSQLGAWASRQSEVLNDRKELEAALAEIDTRFSGQEVPRPAFWFGYRVLPRRLEFWKSREARLHDRTVYECRQKVWQKFSLFP